MSLPRPLQWMATVSRPTPRPVAQGRGRRRRPRRRWRRRVPSTRARRRSATACATRRRGGREDAVGVRVGAHADGGHGRPAAQRPASSVEPRRPGPMTQKRTASMCQATALPGCGPPVGGGTAPAVGLATGVSPVAGQAARSGGLPSVELARARSTTRHLDVPANIMPAERRRRHGPAPLRARRGLRSAWRTCWRRWYTTHMPIYEFCCSAAGTAFEELVRNGTKPECPPCPPATCAGCSRRSPCTRRRPTSAGAAGKSCSSCAELLLCHLPLTTTSPAAGSAPRGGRGVHALCASTRRARRRCSARATRTPTSCSSARRPATTRTSRAGRS